MVERSAAADRRAARGVARQNFHPPSYVCHVSTERAPALGTNTMVFVPI